MLATQNDASGATRVTVAPITHVQPDANKPALEIPPRVKQALGLDSEQSWVILDEVNQFNWPGYDVRPVPGTNDKFAYGFIPPKLYNQIIARLREGARNKQVGAVPRD